VNRVEGILHAPGLAPGGVACRLGFLGEHLFIEGPLAIQLPVTALTVDRGGFDDDTLFLGGEFRGGKIAVAIADPGAQQMLAASAPATFEPQLRRVRRGVHYHRFKWKLATGLLGVMAMGLLLVWWQSEAVTAWAAGRVSLEREQRLGEIWLKQLQADGGLRESGPAVDAVRTIGNRITAGSRYQYRWLVKDDPEINAFAGLAGVVVVHTGLIASARTPEELAGVLAHEAQHVERRHVLQAMIHSAGWAAALAVALGDVGAIASVLIHQAGNLQHSRNLEREADVEGVKAMVRAGISPLGMAQFLGRLQAEQETRGSGLGITLLSSHPATAERIAEVARLSRETTCECRPLAMDWEAVRADVATARKSP
jgi:beta-barrel assembly-enhancing protease